jgi:hypothetical protein
MCPCAGSGCELCSTGIGGQVRYVFAVAETQTRRVGLIEFGRSNGLLIRDWSGRHGGLRGLHMCVRKHSKSTQSRTEIQYLEDTVDPWYLGLICPDPQLALYLTWHKMQMAMPDSFQQRMMEKVAEQAGNPLLMTQKQVFLEKARLAKKVRSSG